MRLDIRGTVSTNHHHQSSVEHLLQNNHSWICRASKELLLDMEIKLCSFLSLV